MIRPAELIEQKRDGGEHDPAELAELILAYARDEVPDYQLAAWCMAVFFRGLTAAETDALTDAMIRSGETLDLGSLLGRKVVDKHSTGGVGDKTSIAVGPIVAACGVPLGKMSGRGLGHTGGTLDKLESIPGFRVELTTEEFVAQLREVGVAIVGQTADLVPADKKLYALRDVTATVDIVPLIASSIMSKKLAAGAEAIVLDVKVGDGAFMRTLDDARVLAEQMRDIGVRAGREVTCLLTDMDQPLGRAVGNALEVDEARDTVRGDGPEDFTELVLDASARLLAHSDLGIDVEEGRRRAEAAIKDGSALEAYERWIRAQGGDPDPSALERAPVRRAVSAPRDGVVRRVGARAVGLAALELGAGRRTKSDPVDHAVGVLCFAKRGDTVLAGDDLAEVHARDDASAERCVEAVLAAYELGDEPPAGARHPARRRRLSLGRRRKLVERVRQPGRPVSSRVGTGSACSPSRLIHTVGIPSAVAGTTSWKWLCATWTSGRRPTCSAKACQCRWAGLYEPISDATIARSNGTPIDAIDDSIRSRSEFERIASRQPRERAVSSSGRTSGKTGQPGRVSAGSASTPSRRALSRSTSR